MPRTKSSNVKKLTSPLGDKNEGEKASEMEPELCTSPKLEDAPDRHGPVTIPGGRPFRMKLLPANRGNPHRYKDYSPEPAGRNVSSSVAVAGGSGLGRARERGSSARQAQSGAGKRTRRLASPDYSAHRKRFGGHDKVRKFKKMRNKRHQKRAPAAKKKEGSSSIEISSVDSDELVSSGGNHADVSSPEQEQPKSAKRMKY